MTNILKCDPDQFHYNGFCFNRNRVPAGEIAITEQECLHLDKPMEPKNNIID